MRKSKLAIVSFILSMIQIVIPILIVIRDLIIEGSMHNLSKVEYLLFYLMSSAYFLAPIAIILGIVALVEIKKKSLEGKWLAIAGIAISATLAMIMMFIFIWTFPG